jgi:hypothetical protein
MPADYRPNVAIHLRYNDDSGRENEAGQRQYSLPLTNLPPRSNVAIHLR